MERKNFFETQSSKEDMHLAAESASQDERWLAALQLSQIFEPWSADLLWRLKDDPDESTRTAARNALRTFPKELLASREQDAQEGAEVEASVWKTRPLPTLVSTSRDQYLAAILDLLNSEGPTAGGRIFRLLVACAQASGSKPPGRGQVKLLLDAMYQANSVSRVDEHLNSDQLDLWIVVAKGWPEFVIRPRNGRDLRDIPVNEARAVLRGDRRFMRDTSNAEIGFRALKMHYEIADNEFHVVGEVLENQWLGLFKNL